jgi:hypothetical protein
MNQVESTKKCSKCQNIKPLSEFSKNKSHHDGYNNYCKCCRKQYSIENRNQRQKHDKKYQNSHSISYKQYQKQYGKLWREINKNKRTTQANFRYNSDIKFKLLQILRSRINYAIHKNSKNEHSIDLLMCTVNEWKRHLEVQFVNGMSWENYGNKENQWSVDHIIPCNFFNLSDPVEQYMCFRYENTRPLWHIDNLRKSNKII